MPWYDNTVQSLQTGKSYSHGDLVTLLAKDFPNMSKNSYHWAIGGMLRSGMLVRSGYNSYLRPSECTKTVYMPAYSEESQLLLKKVAEQFPQVKFTIFETVLLNEFLNHLVAQNTVFLQVEKDASLFVFRFLQEEGIFRLLYKPTKKDYSLYWGKESIVITDMISEAPLLENCPHCICIEKLLVDLYCDRLIGMTFSKAEYRDVMELALSRYAVDRAKMMRYARRRNKSAELLAYIEEITGKRE